MFVLGDLLDFFHILELKGDLTKTSQEASYKLIPNKDGCPWGIVIPFRGLVRDPQR